MNTHTPAVFTTATNDNALEALFATREILGLTDFDPPRSHIGPTGWVENAAAIPQQSYGRVDGGAIVAHIGFFDVEVENTNTSHGTFRFTGHFVPFARQDIGTGERIAVVQDKGGCMGGYVTALVVEAFTAARRTGRTVEIHTDEGRIVTTVTPLSGNRGSRLDHMVMLAGDVQDYLDDNDIEDSEWDRCLDAVIYTADRLHEGNASANMKDTYLDTMVDTLSLMRLKLIVPPHVDGQDAWIEARLADRIRFHQQAFIDARDEGRYWMDQAAMAA